MRETWLRPNRRALIIGALLPILGLLVGSSIAVGFLEIGSSLLGQTVGWTLISVSVFSLLALAMLIRLPRIAYQDGKLLVFLSTMQPIAVPVEIVECFFLGQASSMLHALGGKDSESSTLVVRLAESAVDWHDREVKSILGLWCDGYIVIRGTWCEPLNQALFSKINARLIAAHRESREAVAVAAEESKA